MLIYAVRIGEVEWHLLIYADDVVLGLECKNIERLVNVAVASSGDLDVSLMRLGLALGMSKSYDLLLSPGGGVAGGLFCRNTSGDDQNEPQRLATD